MKMEKTPGEILVTLSSADQEAFGVHYSTMSFADPRTRRFCEYMAVLVCLREGMPETGNVTVRAVENAAGELLLYFSYPGEDLRETFSRVIEFFDLDGLLDCRRVFVSDPALCAEAYVYGDRYYLWYSYDTVPERFASLSLSLLEYGRTSSLDRTFLCEHATPLPRAVSLFLI